jgi:hypothetical protein
MIRNFCLLFRHQRIPELGVNTGRKNNVKISGIRFFFNKFVRSWEESNLTDLNKNDISSSCASELGAADVHITYPCRKPGALAKQFLR